MTQTRELPYIETERLLLTIPTPEAAPRMLAFALENREHLTRWQPPEPAGYDTEKFWRDYLTASQNDFKAGRSMKLVLFERAQPDGAVVGECNFNNFIRGPFQACFLGYKIDYRAEGRGLMREALAAAIAYAFEELRLHRIMANYLPINERSGRLLRRLGFTVEGYARDYLLIGGEWRDHVLTSLTNTKLRPEDIR
ncbi:MAG: GNAT family N-acetyltransferase [Acidobacteria bacterium]|nr:GNAT family N-acetyltransferase [Acidobacteriota bacterium]